MKNVLFVIALILLTHCVFSQTYQTRDYVRIPENVEVTKTFKLKDCNELVPAGSVVKYEKQKKKGEYAVTITKVDTLKKESSIAFDKEVKLTYKSHPGQANLIVNKDSSVLTVNYYLNAFHKLESGETIRLLRYKMNCDTTFSVLSADAAPRKLLADTSVTLWKAFEKDKNMDWFKYSDIVIEVYKNGKITHYFVNRYDSKAAYTIELENRDYLKYRKRAVQAGAVTVPFKCRFGDTKNINGKEIKVENEFVADVNLGLFGGYKIARHRIRYEGGSLKDLSDVGCTVGGFLSLASTTIDSAGTVFSDAPLKKDEKVSIGTISPGLGVMLTLYNVQVGVFVGRDYGFGSNGRKWNFNGQTWLGFGLGYSLSSFWKK
jgi:hypothetical protein